MALSKEVLDFLYEYLTPAGDTSGEDVLSFFIDEGVVDPVALKRILPKYIAEHRTEARVLREAGDFESATYYRKLANLGEQALKSL